MPMQIQSRSSLPALLVIVACLAAGASAQAQEAPASVQPAAVPAEAPIAPAVVPLPESANQAQSAPAVPSSGSAPDAGPDPMTLLTGSPSCFLSPLAVDPAAITAFRSAPQNLLTPYPDGGSRMAQDVRGLAGTDIHTVPVLIDMARTASPGQTAAIGAGLAQAARACVRQRPDVAQIIQQLIIRAGLAPLTTAFVSSSGDVATAAVGGAAAGGAASAGGIGGSPGGGDTSGAGGGVPSSGGVSFARSRPNSTVSTFGAGGSSVVINITLGGGSVSPVR